MMLHVFIFAACTSKYKILTLNNPRDLYLLDHKMCHHVCTGIQSLAGRMCHSHEVLVLRDSNSQLDMYRGYHKCDHIE